MRYEETPKKYTDFNSPVYDVIPSFFVEFANKSRIGSGFRLLKHRLRHSFDPKAPPLMEQKVILFIYEKSKEVGLVLENQIPASMKDAEYQVVTVFTKSDLLATKCGCHAGGHKDERVVCVHTLLIIY